MGYIDRLIEMLKEACEPMEEKKIITVGDILDLLDRDDTKVTLYTYDERGYLIGRADSELWGGLEERQISRIKANSGDNLHVWLYKEDDNDTD